jgi:hypothetical protein
MTTSTTPEPLMYHANTAAVREAVDQCSWSIGIQEPRPKHIEDACFDIAELLDRARDLLDQLIVLEARDRPDARPPQPPERINP